jgi:hypothetical protein
MSQVSEELKKYYADLLILQYKTKHKAYETIRALAGEAVADGIALDVQDAFDLEYAEGRQLDILAKYIGFDRFVSLLVIQNFFKFNIGQTITAINGFNFYQDGLIKSKWLKYSDSGSEDYPLGDEDLRICLKLKLLTNSSPAATSVIKSGLWPLFGNKILLTDNRNMSYSYSVSADYSEVLPVILAYDLLPAPMGVQYSVSVR